MRVLKNGDSLKRAPCLTTLINDVSFNNLLRVSEACILITTGSSHILNRLDLIVFFADAGQVQLDLINLIKHVADLPVCVRLIHFFNRESL